MVRNKNILGICAGGPSGVALFQEGKLSLAVNEERLTKIKLDRSYPHHSIDWCLKESQLSPKEIGIICYGFSKGVEQGEFMASMIKRLGEYSTDPKALKVIHERMSTEAQIDTKEREKFHEETFKRFPETPIYSCYHHQAHQACAYMASPFEEALVLTSDGRGDFESLTISKANPKGIEKLSNSFSWESLGYFYGRMTHLCGFKPERHEGKILGLSAHGDPQVAKSFVEKMIGIKDGKIQTYPGEFYVPFFSNYSEQLKEEASKFSREELAAATQLKLEEIVCELVSTHVKKTGLKNVCLAGGVFSNVRVNQKIRELPMVEGVFIYPNMGDDGLCAGAGYHYLLSQDFESAPIHSLYLGPKISNEELIKELRGFEIETPKKIYSKVADLLKEQRIIGLAQGRAEFGPRALGNRSILITPDSASLVESLNKRLGRNEFMPFAPIISSEIAERCLQNYSASQFSSRHMVMTYNVTPEFRENSSAVVHVDGTVRPQVVFEEDNPFLHKLLNSWHEKTGKMCLINTSFNLHENPIASQEKDVADSFKLNAVDSLLFPPYIAHQRRIN